MGKAMGTLVVAALLLPSIAAAEGPYLTARAAVIMDARSGEVMWERNAYEPLPPASTTKVMTAILALQSGDLDRELQVSTTAADTPPSSIGLRAGQRMRLRDLLYALLLNSANDAAEVIAEGLGGSPTAFAERMTAEAHLMGATTAEFRNPHGLSTPGHVASARDLAVIFRHGLEMPQFRQLLETRATRVPVEARRVSYVSLHSHNRLLFAESDPVIGKTGYTRAAGRCYVGATERGGRQVVVALLGSRDLWGDARRLVAYAVGEEPEAPALVVARGQRTRVQRAEGDDEVGSDPRMARYAVRLGPYGSKNAALSARAKLARRGFNAKLAGRALHVGSFTSLSRAEHVAGQLRQTGYTPTVVLL